MIPMGVFRKRPFRSKYPGPWASPLQVSRTLGVNAADLGQARLCRIIQDGVHYCLASVTSAGRRVYVYHLPRLRNEWAEIGFQLRRSYMVGRRRFRAPLPRIDLAALAKARMDSDPENNFG